MNIDSRKMEFNCYRVYDLRRFTANPKTDSFVVGYHLQKMHDTHTLCSYKTDTWKLKGKWSNASESYFVDDLGERDTICFRCLRIWAVKNGLKYPRQWMIDRLSPEEQEKRKVTMRRDKE